jgi:HD-GYP domain-containing protein (c-di-GMP phosphodiesterase class II)
VNDSAEILWIVIPAISSGLYGLLFFLRRQELGAVAHWYSGFLAMAALWSLGSMLLHANPGFLEPVWIARLLMFGNFGIPLMMLGFTLTFLAVPRQQTWIPAEIVFYVIASVLNLAGLVVTSTEVDHGLITNHYGIGMVAIAAVWTTGFYPSIYLLIRELRKTKDLVYRNRLRYLLLTFVLMLAASLINTTPLAAYPVDHLLAGLTAILISLSISRYQLLEMQQAIQRLFVLILVVLIYVIAVSGAIYVLARLDPSIQLSGSIIAALITFVLLASIRPVRQAASGVIERFFFPEQYNVHELLLAISRISNRLRSPQELGTDILRELAHALQCGHANLFIKEETDSVYQRIANIGDPTNDVEPSFQADSPLIRELAKSGIGTHIDYLREMSRLRSLWINEWQILEAMQVQVLVPILAESEFIGFFCLSGKKDGRPYTYQELRQTLPLLANQVSMALANSRLYTQEQTRANQLASANAELRQTQDALKESADDILRQAARAEALVRIADRLNAQLDLNTVLNAVCEEAARALNAPAASVNLYHEKDCALHLVASYGLPQKYIDLNKPISNELYRRYSQDNPTWTIYADGDAIGALPNGALYQELDIQSIMSARMTREGGVVGILSVLIYGQARTFGEDEQALLKGIAAQAAQAIVNARLYADSQRRLRNVEALRQIDAAITGGTDLGHMLKVILEQVKSQLSIDAADVMLLNTTDNLLVLEEGDGFHATPVRKVSLEEKADPACQAALERRMIQIPDISAAMEAIPATLTAAEGFKAYYNMPLIAKNEVKGVLEVFQRTVMEPGNEWLSFLNALAVQTAIAIDNNQLFVNLQRSNEELRNAYEATLEGWARALEMRDRETQGHTQRVTEMTVRLARLMGVSESDIVHIRRGAILHDIGKMAIPDSILLKPGKLTDDEWETMRHHPVYAYQMMSTISFLRPALDIPYCHHEKWDGSGYPRGLKGEEIPLWARIFAIVDVWDALRSDRPYHKAMSDEEVRDYLLRLSGVQFDPHVVDVFLSMPMAEWQTTANT